MAGERGGFDSPDSGEGEEQKSDRLPDNLELTQDGEPEEPETKVIIVPDNEQAKVLADARAKVEAAASVPTAPIDQVAATQRAEPPASEPRTEEAKQNGLASAKRLWERLVGERTPPPVGKQALADAERDRKADNKQYADEVKKARAAYEQREAERKAAQLAQLQAEASAPAVVSSQTAPMGIREKADQLWKDQYIWRSERKSHNDALKAAEQSRNEENRSYAEDVKRAGEALQEQERAREEARRLAEEQRQEALRAKEAEMASEVELTRIADEADWLDENIERRSELSRNAKDVIAALEDHHKGIHGMYDYAPELHEQIRDEMIDVEKISEKPVATLRYTHELNMREGETRQNLKEKLKSKDIHSATAPVEIQIYSVPDDPNRAYIMRYEDDAGEFQANGTVTIHLGEDAFMLSTKDGKLVASDALLDAINDNEIATATATAGIKEEWPPHTRYDVGSAPNLTKEKTWAKWNKQSLDERQAAELERYDKAHPGAKEERERQEAESNRQFEEAVAAARAKKAAEASAQNASPEPDDKTQPDQAAQAGNAASPLPERPMLLSTEPGAATFRLGQEVVVPTERGPEGGWKVRQLGDSDPEGRRQVEVYRIVDGILQTREISNWDLARLRNPDTIQKPGPMLGAMNKEYSATAAEGAERTAFSKYIDGIRREQSRAGEAVFDIPTKGELTQAQIDELQSIKHKHTPEDLKAIDDEIFARGVHEHSVTGKEEGPRTEFSKYVDKVRREQIRLGNYDFDVQPNGELTEEQLNVLHARVNNHTPEGLKAVDDEIFARGVSAEYSARVAGDSNERSAFSILVDRGRRDRIKSGDYEFHIDQSGDLTDDQIGALLKNATPEEVKELQDELYYRRAQQEYSARGKRPEARTDFSKLVDDVNKDKIYAGDYGFRISPNGELSAEQIKELKDHVGQDKDRRMLNKEIIFRYSQTPQSKRDTPDNRTAYSELVDKIRSKRLAKGEGDFVVDQEGPLADDVIAELEANAATQKEKTGLHDEIFSRVSKGEYSINKQRDERSGFSGLVDKAVREDIDGGNYKSVFDVPAGDQLKPEHVTRLAGLADEKGLRALKNEINKRYKQQVRDAKLFRGVAVTDTSNIETIIDQRAAVLKLERERAEAKAKDRQAAAEAKKVAAEAKKAVEAEIKKAAAAEVKKAALAEARKAAAEAMKKTPDGVSTAPDKTTLPTKEGEAKSTEPLAPEAAGSAEESKDEIDRKNAETILARLNKLRGKELNGQRVFRAMNTMFEEAEDKGLVVLDPSVKPHMLRSAGTEVSDEFIKRWEEIAARKDERPAVSPEAALDPESPAGELSVEIKTLARQKQVDVSEIEALVEKAEAAGLVDPGFNRTGAPDDDIIYDQLVDLYVKNKEQMDKTTRLLNEIDKVRSNKRLTKTQQNIRVRRALNTAIRAGLAQPSSGGIEGFNVIAPSKQSEASRAFIERLEQIAGTGQAENAADGGEANVELKAVDDRPEIADPSENDSRYPAKRKGKKKK